MILEINKEIMTVMIQASASAGKLKEVDEYKKDFMRLMFPDYIDPADKLMKEAANRLNTQDAVIRISAKSGNSLTPEQANRKINNG